MKSGSGVMHLHSKLKSAINQILLEKLIDFQFKVAKM